MQGKTKTGFEFTINDGLKDDYEMIEKLRVADTNPLAFTDLVEYVLGTEQKDKLKDHCRVNGIVSLEKIKEEFVDILSANSETKKP